MSTPTARDRSKAAIGDYIVIFKHDDRKLLGTVVHVTHLAPNRAKFKGGSVEHGGYYVADECDEWRNRGDR